VPTTHAVVDGVCARARVLAQEFCWEDHCFSLLAKYFPAAADALDTLFSVTFNLTYHDFGEGEVTGTDTTPFRQAVWYYVHRLFGICNDDYDYLLVNQTMDKDIKKYVKQVRRARGCCV
jgi:sestrin